MSVLLIRFLVGVKRMMNNIILGFIVGVPGGMFLTLFMLHCLGHFSQRRSDAKFMWLVTFMTAFCLFGGNFLLLWIHYNS